MYAISGRMPIISEKQQNNKTTTETNTNAHANAKDIVARIERKFTSATIVSVADHNHNSRHICICNYQYTDMK